MTPKFYNAFCSADFALQLLTTNVNIERNYWTK